MASTIVRRYFAPAEMFESALFLTFLALIGGFAAVLGGICIDSHCTSRTLPILLQLRFLMTLGREH